jgi:hypothetical protein
MPRDLQFGTGIPLVYFLLYWHALFKSRNRMPVTLIYIPFPASQALPIAGQEL